MTSLVDCRSNWRPKCSLWKSCQQRLHRMRTLSGELQVLHHAQLAVVSRLLIISCAWQFEVSVLGLPAVRPARRVA